MKNRYYTLHPAPVLHQPEGAAATRAGKVLELSGKLGGRRYRPLLGPAQLPNLHNFL